MLYQLPPAVGHTKSDVPPGMLYPGTSQRPADFPCLFGAGIVPPSDDAASSSVPQPINSSPSSHPRLLRRLNVVWAGDGGSLATRGARIQRRCTTGQRSTIQRVRPLSHHSRQPVIDCCAEYYFSQYNKLMKIDKYTDAEYDEHMKGERGEYFGGSAEHL